MKRNTSLNQPAEQIYSLLARARVDLTGAWGTAGISQKRQHFYVYTILLLIILVVHTFKNLDSPGPEESVPGVQAEVAKFTETTGLPKDIPSF